MVGALEKPPRTVFVFFQNTQLLDVSAGEPELRESLSHDVEPALQVLPLRLMLLVGISFYIFQTMSFTIDVFRGQITTPPPA